MGVNGLWYFSKNMEVVIIQRGGPPWLDRSWQKPPVAPVARRATAEAGVDQANKWDFMWKYIRKYMEICFEICLELEHYGNWWKYMENHGNICKYMEIYDIYGNMFETLWKYVEICLKHHGNMWNCMEKYGNIWKYVREFRSSLESSCLMFLGCWHFLVMVRSWVLFPAFPIMSSSPFMKRSKLIRDLHSGWFRYVQIHHMLLVPQW